MLGRLSGRTHAVFTAIWATDGVTWCSACHRTEVCIEAFQKSSAYKPLVQGAVQGQIESSDFFPPLGGGRLGERRGVIRFKVCSILALPTCTLTDLQRMP